MYLYNDTSQNKLKPKKKLYIRTFWSVKKFANLMPLHGDKVSVKCILLSGINLLAMLLKKKTKTKKNHITFMDDVIEIRNKCFNLRMIGM